MGEEGLEKDEEKAILSKGYALALPDGRALFFFKYYKKASPTSEAFKKCSLIMGSIRFLVDFSEKIASDNPAEKMNLTYLGLEDDLDLTMAGKNIYRHSFARFMKTKFRFAHTIEVFLEHYGDKYNVNFPDFDIRKYSDLEEMTWYTYVEKKPEKERTYGKIIY